MSEADKFIGEIAEGRWPPEDWEYGKVTADTRAIIITIAGAADALIEALYGVKSSVMGVSEVIGEG